MNLDNVHIAVIGQGYVGLPLAIAFGKKYPTLGFDINVGRIDELKKGVEEQYVQINDVLVRDVTLPNTIKQAIERKLSQEQMSLEYEFKLESARKEAEKVRIDAKGKADANRILNSSLTTNILRDKGIEATTKLAESPNSKVIVIGSGKDG